jgi:hypothetical protein
MAETVVAAGLLLAGGLVLFVVSIRIGNLFGRRLDRALEARATAGEPDPSEEASADE